MVVTVEGKKTPESDGENQVGGEKHQPKLYPMSRSSPLMP